MLCSTSVQSRAVAAPSRSHARGVPCQRVLRQHSRNTGAAPAVPQGKTENKRMHSRNLSCQASARPAVFLFGFGGGGNDYDDDDFPVTVLKLHVGLFGPIRKFKKQLNELANLYDTDDEDSLHSILEAVVMLLLRNTEYCGYAQSAGKIFDDLDAAEQKYNQVVLEERTKFKDETLVNLDGRRERDLDYRGKGDDYAGLDQWLCLTLVLAVEGPALKLPKLSSVSDLKKALTMLGAVPPEGLVSMELMWTPQAEDDSYTRDELLMDYPTLATIS